jgi:amidohydrolase
MLEEDVFADPRPEAVFGLHVHPKLRVGTLGFRAGGLLAAVDRFEVEVSGKQSHGAYPHLGVDAVVVASHIVVSLQTIASRNVNTSKTVVVTVGKIESGNRFNIMAGTARLIGTIRSHDVKVQKQVHQQLRQIVRHTASAFGATARATIEKLGPVTYNDPVLHDRVRGVLTKTLGPNAIVDAEAQMGGEDFAFYAREVPGLFFLLGVGNPERGIDSMLHTPTFQVDEDSIAFGIESAAHIVLSYLHDLSDSGQPRSRPPR